MFWAHRYRRGAGYDPRYHLQAHAPHILQVFLISLALLVWVVRAARVIAIVDHVEADASFGHIFRQTNRPKGAGPDLCSKGRQSVTVGRENLQLKTPLHMTDKHLTNT